MDGDQENKFVCYSYLCKYFEENPVLLKHLLTLKSLIAQKEKRRIISLKEGNLVLNFEMCKFWHSNYISLSILSLKLFNI